MKFWDQDSSELFMEVCVIWPVTKILETLGGGRGTEGQFMSNTYGCVSVFHKLKSLCFSSKFCFFFLHTFRFWMLF